MKRTLIALVAASTLGACQMTAPETTSDFKSFANNSWMGKSSTITVARSHAAVSASLAAGANKCLNRIQRSSGSTPGPYGPVYQTTTTRYVTETRAVRGGTEMEMRMEHLGNVIVLGPKGPQMYFVAEARPTSGGTQIEMTGARFGAGDIYKAVGQWAKGGPIRCPKLA